MRMERKVRNIRDIVKYVDRDTTKGCTAEFYGVFRGKEQFEDTRIYQKAARRR